MGVLHATHQSMHQCPLLAAGEAVVAGESESLD